MISEVGSLAFWIYDSQNLAWNNFITAEDRGIQMTKELFDDLFADLFETDESGSQTIHSGIMIEEIAYSGVSQRVPPDAKSVNDLQYVVFFL